MRHYFDDIQLRAFEEKIGWNNIVENNVTIGKYLKFEPEIEYAVGNETSSCYSPKKCRFQFPRISKA